MKLEWKGSGTGAGYNIDLYAGPDGHSVIIGTERDVPELRKQIADAFNADWQPIETAPKDRHIWVWGKAHGLAGGFTWQGVSCWDDVFPQTHDASWGYLPAGVVPEYWREVPAPPRT